MVIGVVLIQFSNRIDEISMSYDSECKGKDVCEVTLTPESDIPAPIYVYYQLDNFYQNHRRYVKSRSNGQIGGGELTVDQLKSDCDPIVTNEDIFEVTGIDHSWDPVNPVKLDPKAPANPCGLVAASFFNDTYKVFNGDVEIGIDQTGIAWETDRDKKFKAPPNAS